MCGGKYKNFGVYSTSKCIKIKKNCWANTYANDEVEWAWKLGGSDLNLSS